MGHCSKGELFGGVVCPVDEIRNGSKALDNAYRMRVRTEWKDWIAVSVLAAAHAEEDSFETAVEFANQAFELAPDDEKPGRHRRVEQLTARTPFRISQAVYPPALPVETNAD